MSGATGGDLGQIGELRNGLGHRHWDVSGEARGVGVALRWFRSRSSDYVPHVPPHQVRGEQLSDRIDELARRVERTRDAMAAADRWVGTNAALWLYDLESDRQTIRDSWDAARTLSGRIDRVHDTTARLLREGSRRAWNASADEVRTWLRRSPVSSRVVDRAASGAERAAAWARSPGARAVTRVGGRVFGVVGTAASAVEAVDGYREGDTEQVVTGTLGVGAGVAMMMVACPPAMVGGALVAGGLLVWEYREEIGAAGRAAGRAVASGARAVADGVSDHVGRQVEMAGQVVDGIGDMAGAAKDFVDGLF